MYSGVARRILRNFLPVWKKCQSTAVLLITLTKCHGVVPWNIVYGGLKLWWSRWWCCSVSMWLPRYTRILHLTTTVSDFLEYLLEIWKATRKLPDHKKLQKYKILPCSMKWPCLNVSCLFLVLTQWRFAKVFPIHFLVHDYVTDVFFYCGMTIKLWYHQASCCYIIFLW